MRGKIITIVILLIVVIIGGTGVFFYGALPQFFGDYLSRMMKTRVTMSSMTLDWNTIDISHFNIQNPNGHSTIPTALDAKKIEFKAPLINYIKPHIEIPKIEIHDLYVSIEFYNNSMKEGNWVDIMRAIDAYEPGRRQVHERSFLIEELTMRNIVIDLKRHGRSTLRLKPIRKLTLRNISSSEGLPMQELSHIIIQQVIRSISLASGIQDMLAGFVRAPEAAVKTIFTPFTFFFGGGGSKKKDDSGEPPSRAARTPSERTSR